MAEDIQLKAVVSNTSPLITLAAVGLLDILRQLYGAVVVPEAVRDEYEAGRKSAEPGLDDLQWIHVVASTPDPTLPDSLAPGEAAAIATAIALNARTVLLDERLGQRVANQMGCRWPAHSLYCSERNRQACCRLYGPCWRRSSTRVCI
ncbi:MAG TPA: hypothetical protein VLA19_00340 [Herpetosiphonaceae bacterium]|nr:hypothetical protein [Herpetosiphonaceae bacterium]